MCSPLISNFWPDGPLEKTVAQLPSDRLQHLLQVYVQ
jgi:hypothetical protein